MKRLKRVQERTRERDSVWSLSGDMFGVFGPNGEIRAVNPAWTDLLGYADHELIGTPCEALVSTEDLPLFRDQVALLQSEHPRRDFDVRVRAKDRAFRWINWTITRGGDVLYGIGRDVTQRKHLEEQLRQAQKMEAVGQLTGGIAHDFNNLLTGIVGSLDLMQRESTGPNQTSHGISGATTAAHGRRADTSPARLLPAPAARPEAGRANPSRLDGGPAAAAPSASHRARRCSPAGLWLTRCDPHQLENAILNLVINARDAMPEGGRLTVETRNVCLDDSHAAADHECRRPLCRHRRVRYRVGMPADVIAHAFDPFFTTKPIGQGTGLGLSMVYGFAKQSEGHVRIEQRVGQGTAVRIYLPRYHGELEAAIRPRGSAIFSGQRRRDGAGRRRRAGRAVAYRRGADGSRLPGRRGGGWSVRIAVLESEHRVDLLSPMSVCQV